MGRSAFFVIAAVFVFFCSVVDAVDECEAIEAARNSVNSGGVEEFMQKYKEVINSVAEILPDQRKAMNDMIDASIAIMSFMTEEQKRDLKVEVKSQLDQIAKEASCNGCGATSYLTSLFVGCIILALQHLW